MRLLEKAQGAGGSGHAKFSRCYRGVGASETILAQRTAFCMPQTFGARFRVGEAHSQNWLCLAGFCYHASAATLLLPHFYYHARVVTEAGSSATSMALVPSWQRTVCCSPRLVSTTTKLPS